ncbi:MAG: L-arabinose isomerase [Planctomycetota bacterium]
MTDLESLEVWFVTGSQHLYGPEVLQQVEVDSRKIVTGLNHMGELPVKIVAKPVLTTPDSITHLCQEANAAPNCIGLVTWMHTFSPAKMWIAGLGALQRPYVHLHTQFGRDIPWSSIDMDYMNLHQSAHGGREFGFMCSRLRQNRKVIVGHWEDPVVQQQLGGWMRVAAAWHDSRSARIARIGDNMREVAVTEGDKVAAQIQFGYAVNGYGIGDLVQYVSAVSDAEIQRLCAEYDEQYTLVPSLRTGGDQHSALAEAARIELGLRAFLEEGGFTGFTDTFEDLHGLRQLPGLAVQRLMAEGYGYGAEGDWKHAALVRTLKVMASGLEGGVSFMEDYTYHFHPDGKKVLGAHMLEICPSIAATRPSCEIHPLGIGGKEDPVRLVFDAASGPAINVSMVDMGNRFRMVVNQVDVIPPDEPLPKLPVARATWIPRPDLDTAAAAWILAGGAHHTCFAQPVTIAHMQDFAEMADVEILAITDNTDTWTFKNQLRWNEAYYSGRG